MIIQSRKVLKPRRRRDWYPTETPVVRCALATLPPATRPVRILDVGAGDGPWGAVAAERWPEARLVGVELSTEPPPPWYHAWRHGDVRTMPWYETFDLVMGNIPFGIAEACVRRAMDLLEPGGHIVYLLRLAFLESQERAEGLWVEYPCRTVRVFAKRPSFTLDGKTDATAYAVFWWTKGYHGRPEIDWITATMIRAAADPVPAVAPYQLRLAVCG